MPRSGDVSIYFYAYGYNMPWHLPTDTAEPSAREGGAIGRSEVRLPLMWKSRIVSRNVEG